MKNSSPPQSGTFNVRIAIAVVLCTLAASLGWLSFAANPPSGTITTAGPAVTWNGTSGTGAPTAGGESECAADGSNCDTFSLTISGTPSDWATANKRVHVQINWLTPSSDYDMFIHKGDLTGPIVVESANGGTTQEQGDLDPTRPNIGTGLFTVHVVYFAATSADQYRGAATLTDGPIPPIPAPSPAVALVAPRFENYNPPAAGPATLGRSSGEPSIGVGMPITGHPEGRAMFQSDVNTLRVTFNGCSFPKALWENRPAPTSAQDFDPILWSDPATGRTIVHLLTFVANPAVGESSFTDNDGDNWLPSKGSGIGSGVDHQTVGGGPYHPTTLSPPVVEPPHPLYPNAVYYCSQALVDASCARSDDGGINYGASTVTYQAECGGLHGHVKVAPDGTVYLPNKGCGGEQAVIVSENNGATWSIRHLARSTSGGSDPSVAIDKGNKLYFAYADGDTKLGVTTSTDHGQTWSTPYDVGAAFGLNNVVYPAFVAGDAGRAAVAFMGTPTTGGLQATSFAGVWHLYVASTFDGGATWTTVDATPNDATQRGCIWQGGGANACRNLLDFFDATIDHEGRVLIGYADGCVGGECAQAAPTASGNSYTALATIARQSGGKRMFAAFDAVADTGNTSRPGTPNLTAVRNGGLVKLGWSEADNGGSAITGYRIYRSTSSNTETLFASVPATQLRFNDVTASDPSKTYFYKVEALNAQGASCKENEVSARYVGDSHVGNGFTVAGDPTGDQLGAPANADLDVQTLSILEPSSGPYADMIVFNLKVANLNFIPDKRMWRIIWADPRSIDQQFYVGMTMDGAVTFEYGRVKTTTAALAVSKPDTVKVGTPNFGGYDPSGLITIAVSKDKIGNVQAGDILGAFSVRTYPEVKTLVKSTDAVDTTSNATANDSTANAATYAVVGSGPGPQLTSVVSRKRQGKAGTFDVNLPTTGPVGIECRTGGSTGAHQLVFTFANTVTSASAAVTSGTGAVSSVSGSGTPVITVNLSGVTDVQTIQVTLSVSDSSQVTTVTAPMGVLGGDVNGDRVVNSQDQKFINSKSGQTATAATFRADVTIDGLINGNDSSFVGSRNGDKLP